jgi:glycosyltransferase involved in cell wall biosynthesis
MSEISAPTPKISVIMPAYNAQKYIAEAIESILNQTFRDFEFIIIDDASTDKTWEIIQKYAQKDRRTIALKNAENLQNYKTRNNGIAIARGKYIATMDADDWSYPDRLQKQVEFMEKNPEVVLCGSFVEICDKNLDVLNKRNYPETDEKIRKKLFRYSPFCHPSTMWRTVTVKKVGGYNDVYPIAQDYKMEFKVGRFGKFANLPEVLHKLRVHSGSLSMRYSKKQELYTLRIRLKAVIKYGYRMTVFDKGYFLAQCISIFLIPSRTKFWLFNFLRRFFLIFAFTITTFDIFD